MSSIGPYPDSPNKINYEGNQIKIEMVVNKDTIELCWNLPENINQASLPPEFYDGMVILLDTKPINTKLKTSQFYTADNTADRNKHVGDTVGTCLVVGAFYNDKVTHELTITDTIPNTNYYIAGFAVDNVRQYDDGSFAYSLPLELNNTPKDTKGYQIVKLGVLPEDPLTLVNQNLEMWIDSKKYDFNITASNYKELIDQINKAILGSDNVYIGDVPFNTNGYSVRDGKLYTFDGTNEYQTECYFGPYAQNKLADGTYWITDEFLKRWEVDHWADVPVFAYKKPINELNCSDYWFNGTNAFKWNTTWKKSKTYISDIDPANIKEFPCNTIWFDGNNYYKYGKTSCKPNWTKLNVYSSHDNPLLFSDGYYWFNNDTLYQLVDKKWVIVDVNIDLIRPQVWVTTNWYNKKENKIYQFSEVTLQWELLPISIDVIDFDYTVPGDWYWDKDGVLFAWDELNEQWVKVKYLSSKNDPSLSTVKTGEYWFNGLLHQWDGSQWVDIVDYISQPNEPILNIGDFWKDTINKRYLQYDGISWTLVKGLSLIADPSILITGQFWFNTTTATLYTWNGINWQSLMYTTTSLMPKAGDLWYNTSTSTLSKWNKNWILIDPKASAALIDGDIKFTSHTLGSTSKIYIPESVGQVSNLFRYTSPVGQIQAPVNGTDGIPVEPMYKQMGVGLDGSLDERRNTIDRILMMLGYPAVQIELDRSQLELCVDLGIGMFRKLSNSAYERAIFFLDLEPNKQQYLLSSKASGFNKIVSIQGIHRRSYAYMATSAGNGIYAQQFLQWMYTPTMGMDMISIELVEGYKELMDTMFATRIVHRFNERTRALDLYQHIGMNERVIVDCVIERTESELLTDRISSKWILMWSLAEACTMLANIRGKFSSIPGAGGSVSLNASELQSRADEMFEKCRFEIDNYIASEPEKMGNAGSIILG